MPSYIESQRLRTGFISSFLINPSPKCSGSDCDCRDCTIRSIGTGKAEDEAWLRKRQSPNQAAYDFRVLSARLAMLKDEVYIPRRFNPAMFAGTDGRHTPEELFPEGAVTFASFPGFVPYRFILDYPRPLGPRVSTKIQLIYTDGACSNNGGAHPKAGAGFSFCKLGRENTRGCVSVPVERRGPYGDLYQQTSNRAELRAVIAALEWRKWYREGWDALVIATDSTYVANGATSWVSSWVNRDWCKSNGDKAANKDLWKYLLMLFRQYAIHGCEILVWHIPRGQNISADQAAARALSSTTPTEWTIGKDNLLRVDTVFDF